MASFFRESPKSITRPDIAPRKVKAKSLEAMANLFHCSGSVRLRFQRWNLYPQPLPQNVASKKVEEKKPEEKKPEPKKEEEEEEDVLDFDALGDDDDDAETAAILAKKKAEAEAAKKKAAKPVPVARSSLILDVKPEGSETDMAALEAQIRSIAMEGLVWAGSELVPVAFGVKKIRIIANIVDALVSVDDLQEKIETFEDVQSSDIYAFNKL